MRGSGPREKIVKGRGDLFVAKGVVAGEEDRRVGLARLAHWYPVEIPGAVGCETEAFPASMFREINRVFLAFEIEREKRFNPFGGAHALAVLATYFEFFGENGLVVAVEREKALRQKGTHFLLHLGGIGVDQPPTERIAGRLTLLGRHAVTELVQKPADPESCHEQKERRHQGAKHFDHQGF